jgi:hypothetical protein
MNKLGLKIKLDGTVITSSIHAVSAGKSVIYGQCIVHIPESQTKYLTLHLILNKSSSFDDPGEGGPLASLLIEKIA